MLQDEVLNRRMTQAAAHTRANGTYVLCGLPASLRVDVRVEAAAGATGTLALAPAATPVRRHDFTIGRRGAQAVTVSGVVRDARGRPAPRATVTVYGVKPGSAQTDDAGRFTAENVPVGTQSFETRQSGSWPRMLEVDVPSAGLRELGLALGRRAASPGPASSSAPPDPEDRTGFEERRTAGVGRFLTASEIEARKPRSVGDALLRLPPLVVGGTKRNPSKAVELLLRAEGKPVGEIVYTPMVKMQLSGSTLCTPGYFLNGVAWAPELPGQAQAEIEKVLGIAAIRGIEVYAPTAIPPLFDRHTSCGSVVIWTK